LCRSFAHPTAAPCRHGPAAQLAGIRQHAPSACPARLCGRHCANPRHDGRDVKDRDCRPPFQSDGIVANTSGGAGVLRKARLAGGWAYHASRSGWLDAPSGPRGGPSGIGSVFNGPRWNIVIITLRHRNILAKRLAASQFIASRCMLDSLPAH